MTMALDKRVDALGQLVLSMGWADADTIDEYRHRVGEDWLPTNGARHDPRHMVLPLRPTGTDGWSEEELFRLVRRLPRPPSQGRLNRSPPFKVPCRGEFP